MKQVNPVFAAIVHNAVENSGWQEFYRDSFMVLCDGTHRHILTLASKDENGIEKRLLACTMQVRSVEIGIILYRIQLRFELINEGHVQFLCLFQGYDREQTIYLGGNDQKYIKFSDNLLKI